MEHIRRPGSARSMWRPYKMMGSNTCGGSDLIDNAIFVPSFFSKRLFTDSKSMLLLSSFRPQKDSFRSWDSEFPAPPLSFISPTGCLGYRRKKLLTSSILTSYLPIAGHSRNQTSSLPSVFSTLKRTL